jgi:uncharacterized protein
MHPAKILKRLVYILLIVATVPACTENNNDVSAQSQNQQILDSFPAPVSYVNDYAFLYSRSQRDSLENILGNFEKSTTVQIALIIFKESMVPKDSLEALTQKIGNAWGVGQKEANNGIVIGICPEYRKMTIRNGYGIEKILSDAETKEIIDKYFIPDFKGSKYFEGTISGLQALIETLTKKLKDQKSGT